MLLADDVGVPPDEDDCVELLVLPLSALAPAKSEAVFALKSEAKSIFEPDPLPSPESFFDELPLPDPDSPAKPERPPKFESKELLPRLFMPNKLANDASGLEAAAAAAAAACVEDVPLEIVLVGVAVDESDMMYMRSNVLSGKVTLEF